MLIRVRAVLFFVSLFMLPACNLSDQNLPTPDAQNNVYITATPLLPTPNQDGIIMITVTPNHNQVIQAAADLYTTNQTTAAPPPTQAIQPTRITDPQTLLADAERLLINGYFEEAVRAYQALLDQIAEPATRARAAFKLGQAALREGLFQEAVTALTLLITELPQQPEAAQAYFLRGDAYLGLGAWENAIADFQQYQQIRPNLIDSYLYERIADAQLALGQVDAALASYERAIQAGRSLIPQLILQERVAQNYISTGQIDAAIIIYNDILTVARNAGYRASIELYAAQAYLAAGRTEEALNRAQTILQNYPETVSAYEALTILDAQAVEISSYQRGIVYYTYGDYPAAIDAFNDYTSNFVLDAIPARLYLLLGRAYRELGNWEAARIAFQTLLNQYPADPLIGTALLERGRTYFLEGNIPTAIETYLAVADTYPNLSSTAAEALWRAGFLYGTRLNDNDTARQTFIQLATDYPNSDWALSGLQIAASSAVANGQIDIAENLYNRLAAMASGEEQAQAYYWAGRFAQQRGDQETANTAFSQAQTAAPDSFFAQRANDILIGREAFAPPASIRFTFDDLAEQQQAEAWLRGTFAIQQTTALSPLSASLQQDPRMIRGRELWAVAAHQEAQQEFDAILDEARANDDVLTSYQMAHFLRDLGDYRSSIVAAADVIVASGQATLAVPPYLARMRYPAFYNDLIQQQADQYGFDPLLMLSLMRQESLFDANATSVANALGLAQVIPSTAQYIATELNWQNFEDRDLYRPYIGIAFGAFYLDEQLGIFDNNVAAALAAYNAGPGYTLDWYRLSGGDVDAFVSTITFDETERYVKRIYSHYTIYRQLYSLP